MNPKRLKGFSLLELVIVLSLSGLVVSIGGSIWQVMVQIHQHYQSQHAQVYTSMQVQHSLEVDAIQTHYLVQPQANHWILLGRTRDTIVHYQYEAPYLMRMHSIRTDSFDFSGLVQVLSNQKGILFEDTLRHQAYQLLLWPVSNARPIP